jgi:hypothetical protein
MTCYQVDTVSFEAVAADRTPSNRHRQVGQVQPHRDVAGPAPFDDLHVGAGRGTIEHRRPLCHGMAVALLAWQVAGFRRRARMSDQQTPSLIEVGANIQDGDLRLWRAKEAVRQGELRLAAQAAIRTALEARATAITGWAAASFLALAAATAATVGVVPHI